MARPGRPERNRTARSFRQLRRFHHVINSDKVFGTHRSFVIAPLSRFSRYHYSVLVVSDGNSTEVCTTPPARDSRPVPICSVTVVHVKYLRFQSSDAIRTSENSRNFRAK